jgi:serine/threonine-protein kinase PpkA
MAAMLAKVCQIVAVMLAVVAASLSHGFGAPTLGAGEVNCQPPQVCRVTTTNLPLMALPRPFSNLYRSQSTAVDQIIRENVPAFFPLYVFARPASGSPQTGTDPEGWYQVGPSVKAPVGWMQAKDVFEWRQALVVSYKHPGGKNKADRRNPVVMFKDQTSLDAIISAPDREARAKGLYDRLSQHDVPPELVSIEPERFVDIDEKMYLLPVLDFKPIDGFDDPAFDLLLAAAVPGARAGIGESHVKPGTLPETLSEGVTKELARINVDVVFVIDMTASMGPFIDQTRTAVSDLARVITKDVTVGERVRFGLVGYRDNVDMMPGLEFTTKNFTPELVGDQAFIEAVSHATEAQVTSGDYPEEMFAGIKQGIASAWRPNSLRFIILVGDASGHPPGHPQNTTGNLDLPQLRELASQDKITIAAIHLLNPMGQADWGTAKQQFKVLATNEGLESDDLYFPVPAYDQSAYDKVVKSIAGRILALMDPAQQATLTKLVAGNAAGQQLNVPSEAAAGPASDDAAIGGKVTEAVTAALITYLGKEATPPRDVTGWAFDHDLVDPRKSALDVRVLLSKQDLNNLIVALEQLLEAMSNAKFTEQGLFDSLQGIVATTMKDRKDLNFTSAKELSQTNLLPSWIASLPYKSAVLSLSSAKYQAMTADERARLEQTVKSDLQLYRDTSNNDKLWIKLDERDADIDRVYPIPLFALP